MADAPDAADDARRIEVVAWAICPWVRRLMNIGGSRAPVCRRCPASEQNPPYGRGTRACRRFAEGLARDAVASWRAAEEELRREDGDG